MSMTRPLISPVPPSAMFYLLRAAICSSKDKGFLVSSLPLAAAAAALAA